MRKVMALVLGLCFVATLAFAQTPTSNAVSAPTSAPVSMVENTQLTMKGEIIDNMCAGSQKPENLAAFVKTHTKECALMPNCAASGYSIFSEGKLAKFDKDSNAKIEDFLKKADSKLAVEVVAIKVGDELSLVSIKNQ